MVEAANGAASERQAAPHGTERILGLDVVRGAALIGIAFANAPLFFGPRLLAFHVPAPHSSWANTLAIVGMNTLQAQHLYLVFAWLFGYGLERQHRNGHVCAAPVQRRLGMLLAIGALHATLVWYGDVLVAYAVLGALVVALRPVPAQRLLRVAIGLLLVLPMASVMAGASGAAPSLDWHVVRAIVHEYAAYRSADPQRVLLQRWTDLGSQAISLLAAAPSLLGMMLLGTTAARLNVVDVLAAAPRVAHRVVLLLLALGVSYTAGVVLLQFYHGHEYLGRVVLASGPLAGAALCGALLVWCVANDHVLQHRSLARALGALGRVSISAYLTQSVVCTTLAYGAGWFGRLTPATMACVIAGLVGTQLVAAVWWLRWAAWGPVEWLWRWASSQSRPRWRRAHEYAGGTVVTCTAHESTPN